MNKFSEYAREDGIKIINFEKEKMIQMTNEEFK